MQHSIYIRSRRMTPISFKITSRVFIRTLGSFIMSEANKIKLNPEAVQGYCERKKKSPKPKKSAAFILRISLFFLCRYHSIVRLPRTVQDVIFFTPKAYKGTPSGRKKSETKKPQPKLRISLFFLCRYHSMSDCRERYKT